MNLTVESIQRYKQLLAQGLVNDFMIEDILDYTREIENLLDKHYVDPDGKTWRERFLTGES